MYDGIMPDWFNPQMLQQAPAAMGPEQVAAAFAKAGVPPSAVAPAISQQEAPVGDSFNPTAGAGATGAQGANPFRGLTQPKAPEPQKVSTPQVPRPAGTVKGGELLAMLQALGAGGGGGAGGAYKPTPLGTAIGRF